MSKRCAKCEKPVYPIEELKCLDKIWHKSCFKCENCGMTLNMKNYKGYEKKPYCVAHYPTTKFTAVADTPENRRIATNTKLQSSIDYHSDFEKNKSKYTAIADNPDLLRCKMATINASLIKYHEDFEKQKGKRITVADDPELQRIKQNTQIQSEISYKGIKQTRDIMEQRRPEQAQDDPNAPAAANPHAGKGMVSKAIYDYTAADTDEVSFVEGDIIIHCQPIDQGWMEGTVERTSQRGMLPSNYVQPV